MIERLYVQNFRCLESVTLDFAGTPSALIIGKNGAGKSTTRHALSVFQSICRGSSRVGTLVVPSDFSFLHVDRPMRFEIDVTLAGRRFKYAISFDWPDTFREARILDESLAVDGQDIFTRHQAQVQLPGGGNFGLDWHVFALPVPKGIPRGNGSDRTHPGSNVRLLRAAFCRIGTRWLQFRLLPAFATG
jgi:energy-coupling factor transporter ATP-binding protein EcfA2